jgi:hypothetical protein
MSANDLDVIAGWVSRLGKRTELPPDSSGQAVIDRVAEGRDPAALPVLRRALKAAAEYRQFWESRDYKTQPGLWVTVALAISMESKLTHAIERCTPEGETVAVVDPRRWWEFWK